jgi:hypothetical protein
LSCSVASHVSCGSEHGIEEHQPLDGAGDGRRSASEVGFANALYSVLSWKCRSERVRTAVGGGVPFGHSVGKNDEFLNEWIQIGKLPTSVAAVNCLVQDGD